jgi:hypothetical protein
MTLMKRDSGSGMTRGPLRTIIGLRGNQMTMNWKVEKIVQKFLISLHGMITVWACGMMLHVGMRRDIFARYLL